jgi:hypothetical protein
MFGLKLKCAITTFDCYNFICTEPNESPRRQCIPKQVTAYGQLDRHTGSSVKILADSSVHRMVGSGTYKKS